MGFFSIKNKLIAAFLFVAIIPLSILSFHNLKEYRTELFNLSFHRLLAGAQFTCGKLNTFFINNLNNMSIESQFPSYRELIAGDQGVRNSMSPHLLAIIRILEHREYQLYIRSYFIMDLKGIVILSIDPADTGKNLSSCEFFKKAVAENYSIFTLEFDGSPAGKGLFFASPVRDEEGVPIGVACVQYNFAILSRIVSEGSLAGGEGSSALLFDEKGELIASSVFIENSRDIVLKKDQSGASSQALPLSIAGVDYFGVTSGEIVQKKWTVEYIQPAHLYLKPVRDHFNFMLVFNIVVVFLVIFLAYFIGKKITAPVVELTAAAARLSLDELDTAIVVKSSDEIGVLSKTFDQMAKRLKTALDERKKTETEIIAARDAAEKASKIKSQFLANMSHELRTPMNGIVGFGKMLQYTELTERQKEFVDLINISSEHLLDIIRDILDISKIESGNLRIMNEKFDLKLIVDQVADFFKPHFLKKSIDFVVNYSVDSPCDFIGDSVRVKQILMNLLSNSLKFTHAGSVELSLAELERLPQASVLRFIVSDTGIGISDEKIPEIFNMFYQVDNTTTKSYQGTGLGLSIVKELVGLMNGKIYVESRVSAGCKFTVDIKLETGAGNVQTSSDQVAFDVSKALSGVKMRILLVDDDVMSHRLIEYILRDTECSLEIADNGLVALEKLSKCEYDLVLMDIQMPEMDGVSVIETIRARESGNKRIPVVVVSAYASPADKEKFLSAGADDYISKPIDFNTFIGKIKLFFKA